MKIAILDGYCLNPGDLHWDQIQQFADTEIYERTTKDQVIERSQGAEILLTNKTGITAEMMDQLPELKYIGVLATGYNVVDTEAAKERGILVTNIPAYSTASVAQMVFAHILQITNQVALHAKAVRNGKWSNSKDFCFWDSPQTELQDKTIGLVGLGNTGMATAQIAHAFGMKIIALTSKSQEQLPAFIKPVDKKTLLSESDILSLHCPLTDNTKHFINAETLKEMKQTAILINTGRGPLIDEEALAEALNANRLYAAGLDVLSAEPPKADNPLLSAQNCYITPHIAWATFEARQRLMRIATDNIAAYISKNPINVVNA